MVATRKNGKKPSTPSTSYRDRIIDLRRVPASELVPHPLNPRVHPDAQNSALRSSLEARGIADTLLTYVRADGRLGLIDGHERTELLGDALVPVVVTDLTEEEATAFLAEHDAITLLALYDASRSEQLARALDSRHTASADLLRMVAETNPAASLLEAIMLREEERAPWLHGGSGGGYPEDEDSDDPESATTDDWAFDDDGRLSEEDEDQDADSASADAPHTPPLFDRERILDAAMAHYRATGFPYRKLPVFVSMQRLNKLANTPHERLLRTSVGGDVADTYHPHRFAAHVVSGTSSGRHNSPLESFAEDKLLRHALALRFDDAGVLHDGYPTTLNVVNHTQAVSNFRPGFAAYLYREYVTQPGSIVLDTSTGYGGRLVGYFASGVWRGAEDGGSGGRYVGIDPNTLTHAGNMRMAADLGFSEHVTLINEPAEDVDVDAPREGLPGGLRGACDFAFTSPPYCVKERYADEETQSWRRYPTPQAWRAGFLLPMLRLQYDALKPGAYSLINVDDVLVAGEEVPLVAWTLEAARSVGFEHVETRGFELATSFGLGHDAGADEREPVLVLRKPVTASSTSPNTHDDTKPATAQRTSVTSPQPMTLAGWMARLYRETADERRLSDGRFLGVWPEELREYLELLCLLHSDALAGPARFAVASGLLLNQSATKPYEPNTCALLFSGGKDSIAAGLIAEREHGYRVHALFVRKVNHRFPDEAPNAERIARLLGWDFSYVTPTRLPKAFADGVVKNQYIAAIALESLPSIPGALAFGNHAYDDANSCPWFSDLACAYDAFDAALAAAYGGGRAVAAKEPPTPTTTLNRLAPLRDEVQSFALWRELSPEIQQLTTSCILPEYNKIAHRRRSLAKGVPLTDYECGVCEKCRGKALIFAAHFPDDPITRAYPAWYLDECRRRLAKVVSGDDGGGDGWTHTHPRLITWDIEDAKRENRAPQSSMDHYIHDVLGGLGRYEAKVKPREWPAAVEPIVTRVDARTGYALAGEPPLVTVAVAREQAQVTDMTPPDESDNPETLNDVIGE